MEEGFVTYSASGSGLNTSQGDSISRFPEMVKRIIQALPAQQRSCLAPSSMQLASGPRILTSKSEVELAPLFAQVGECRQIYSERFFFFKNPILTPNRSVRTSTALTVIWIDSPCHFPSGLKFTLHTLSKFVIISLFQDGEQYGGSRHGLAQPANS